MKTLALALACGLAACAEEHPLGAVLTDPDSVLVWRLKAVTGERPIAPGTFLVRGGDSPPGLVLEIESVSSKRGKEFAGGAAAVLAKTGARRDAAGEGMHYGCRFTKAKESVEVLIGDGVAGVVVEIQKGLFVVQKVSPLPADAAKTLNDILAKAFPTEPDERAVAELGAYACRLLQEADRVETFRIRDVDDAKEGEEAIAKRRITARGKEFGKEFARDLGFLFFDGEFGVAPMAECFKPGVAFRVWRGKEKVDLLLCFACSNVELHSFDPKAPEARSQLVPMGGAWSGLVRLAKKALPEDADIARLPE
jgi:hypothetical protein